MKGLAGKFVWLLTLFVITLTVFALGKEAVVLLAVFQPGAARAEGEELTHSAEEFVYVLEGSAMMTRAGEEPITFTQGNSWYNNHSQEHKLQNASTTEPLSVLAVWIGKKGVDFVRYGLTDPRAKPENLRHLVPERMPSGLPLHEFLFE